MKNIVSTFISNQLNIEVTCVKAVGNYSEFVDDVFVKSTGYFNPKTEEFKTYQEKYIELLNEGKCILSKDILIFASNCGYENAYLNYAKNYIKSKNEDNLINDLNDVSCYSMVKSFIKMINDGALTSETSINRLKKYFKNEDVIHNYI